MPEMFQKGGIEKPGQVAGLSFIFSRLPFDVIGNFGNQFFLILLSTYSSIRHILSCRSGCRLGNPNNQRLLISNYLHLRDDAVISHPRHCLHRIKTIYQLFTAIKQRSVGPYWESGPSILGSSGPQAQKSK